MKLLIIEDEARVADFLSRGLKSERHTVTIARDGLQGLELGTSETFDVIILDLMLPKMHGHEVCQTLRQRGVMTPILVLSALDAVSDRVEGLRLGADDYLTKPFAFDELLARIEALGRRPLSISSAPARLEFADLVYDRETLQIWRGEEAIKLTAKELAILDLLLSAPGKVFSRERILNNVWGISEDPMTNVVDVYLARLRKKLSGPSRYNLFETVRGLGYRINTQPTPQPQLQAEEAG